MGALQLLRNTLFILIHVLLVASAGFGADNESPERMDLYVVPNFHPGCMGWLVRYSEERNYCLYSYLAHLDRMAKDTPYKFAFSEIPHLITMMEFEPKRFEEFKQRVKEGRVEVVNAFVGEPTVNLSGGEALVQQGVQGLRWYKQIMNVKPRYCWMIDIVGWHEQMAQIVSGLGLEAFVYCRYNPTPLKSKRSHPVHWIQSPDGTRAPAVGLGHYYRNFAKAFRSVGALTEEELLAEIESAEKKAKQFPDGAPVLLLAGSRDYSLPPNYENYPAELIEAWNSQPSSLKIRMATLSDYMDVLLPLLRSGKYDIPVVTGGSSKYGWSAFWMSAPFYKRCYRRSEHQLQSAEAIATIAGLKAGTQYPSQEFANSWLLMALNMDRNLLWGVGVDGTFYDKESWDARDRFEYVGAVCARANQQAISALTRKEESSVVLFNPVNWTRKTPFEIRLPEGKTLAEADCQLLEDGKTTLADVSLPSFSLSSLKLKWAGRRSPVKTTLTDRIDTAYYSARVDPNTGALVSLKLRSSGREILGGPANVVLAESGGNVHWVPEKPKRSLLAGSSSYKPIITVTAGKLAAVVDIRSNFHGGELRRVLRFHNQSPRIDFLTETNDVPPGTTLSVEFPLAERITEVRQGIPYGFSHGAWGRKDSRLTGTTKGIIPAIRWSDYGLETGGGVALLDRGVPARELVGSTAILLLHNVCDTYYKRPVTWMNHKGRQTYEYALVVREQPWNRANIPRMAWEYNSPILAVAGRCVFGPESLVETSDNVIVQALRRNDAEIELRLLECMGESGPARAKINLPHSSAALTNLLGQERQLLEGLGEYTFDVRPQQIVTLRLCASGKVAPVKALRSFDSVIPIDKRQYMRGSRNPRLVGHPPTE